jgi:hypothetical protein
MTTKTHKRRNVGVLRSIYVLSAMATGISASATASAQTSPLLGSLPGVGLSFATMQPLDVMSLRTPMPEWRRRLHSSSHDQMFAGEYASKVSTIYVTPGEAVRPSRLRISYVSSVSTMPENSRLLVEINGTAIGERNVGAASRPELIEFDVPAGILQTGINAVRTTLRQNHRVDCSREATYELWTSIVPEDSGFVFEADASIPSDLQALSAVEPSLDGRVVMRLHSGSDPTSLQHAARVAQSTAIAGRYQNPDVVLGDADGAYGIDVFVGTDSMIRSLGRIPPAGAGPRVGLTRDGATNRLSLIVAGSTMGELDLAISLLEQRARALALSGDPEGLAAVERRHGFRIDGNQTVRLSDLGFRTTSFSGRHFREEITLAMPADFYPGAYGRMTLALDAAYGGDLGPGASFLVRVNGAIVATIPMTKAGGDVLRKRALNLALEAFKPGLNTVSFEADTQSRADATCAPEALLDRRERLLISGTSTLSIPPLAQIGMLPNVAGLASGGLGVLSADGPVTVYAPGADRDALAAAISLFARNAATERKVIPVSFTFSPPSDPLEHVLAIGAINRLDDGILSLAELVPGDLRVAWDRQQQRLPPIPERPVPQAGPQMAPATASAWLDSVQVASVGDSLIDLFEPQTTSGINRLSDEAHSFSGSGNRLDVGFRNASGIAENGLGDRLGAGFDIMRNVDFGSWSSVSDMLPRALARIAPDEPAIKVTPSQTLVIAQGTQSGVGGNWRTNLSSVAASDLTIDQLTDLRQAVADIFSLPRTGSMTVITAPTGEALRQGMRDFMSAGHHQQLVGQAVTYDAAAGLVTARVTTPSALVETQPRSFQNIRLVTAGWLSHNVQLYIIGLLGLAALFSLALYGWVRRAGVRN